MMVADGIFRIKLKHPNLPQGVNVYLLTGEKELCLIDAGYGDDESVKTIISTIQRLGLDVEGLSLVVNTHGHPDHTGGNVPLKRLTKAKIAIHRLEAPRIRPLKADTLLEDGDTVPINAARLRVIHTPGHSPGQICLYDEKRRLLFSGDHIVEGTLTGTVYIGPPDGSVDQYLSSLKKLMTLDVEMILPGHGRPILEPKKKIREILTHHRMREHQIMEVLRTGEKTADQIAEAIYGGLVARPMGRGAIVGRVEKLVHDGLVEVIRRGGVEHYRLRDEGT
ncbi:MAG: MBL fold metallo-hydrolase [Candidatus Bathyarchaeia archaeon]